MTTPSATTITFVVQSKSSAGPDMVNVSFVEAAETVTTVNGTTFQQSFNRTLAQADADQYEINSRWVQSLTKETAAPAAKTTSTPA